MKGAMLGIIGLTVASLGVLVLAQQRSSSDLILNGNFDAAMELWSPVSPGNAKGSIRLTTDEPFNSQSPAALRIEATQYGFGVAYTTPGGLQVKSGDWYDISFAGRMESPGSVGLLFSLETPDGKKYCARTTLPEIGRVGTPLEGNPSWRKYTVSLHAYASDPTCRLVITPIEPATVVIDSISMTPRK
jgi:hypothetical protein